jgi:hypothetical protein
LLRADDRSGDHADVPQTGFLVALAPVFWRIVELPASTSNTDERLRKRRQPASIWFYAFQLLLFRSAIADTPSTTAR